MAKRKQARKQARKPWENRIVETGSKPPGEFRLNPDNWKIHLALQEAGLREILERVGWVQDVIENKRTSKKWGNERGLETVVDGELRIRLAIEHEEPEVPYKVVDLDPEEEALVLFAFDPIGTLIDQEISKTAALADRVDLGEGDLDMALAMLRNDAILAAEVDAGLSGSRPSGGMGTGLTKAAKYLKIVVHGDGLLLFEQAVQATGERNRAEAVVEICEHYLADFGEGAG